MEILKEFLENFFELANSISIFILVGLFIAGILKELIPADFVSKKLGKKSFGSVFKAALFGIPLPLCSCSVIPFASSLKKEGASKGAVQSFLISTPITGVDSILAIYGVFGWFFTIYKVISSFIIAIVAGVLQNIFDKDEVKKEAPKFSAFSPIKQTSESSCCSQTSSCCSSDTKTDTKKSFSLKRAMDYGFGTLFKDIAKPLFWGLLLGALFTTFFPADLANKMFENQYLTYLAVLVISIPLYVCATASLPIAAAFILSGMSFGAAFMFLSAGPATNSVTIGVVAKSLGKKAVFIYLGTIFILSFAFGFIFDSFFESTGLNASFQIHEEEGLLYSLASIFLIGHIFVTWVKELKSKNSKESCCSTTSSSSCGCH